MADSPDRRLNESHKLNLKGLRRLYAILKLLCVSTTFMLFILLLTLCLGQQLVIYNIGLLPSEYFKVLGGKDRASFKPLIVKSFSLIVMISLCKSATELTAGHLYIVYRDILTNHLHAKYFSSSETLYHVNMSLKGVDNADQRISQDVERLCLQLREVASKLIISPLTIIYYSVQCFQVTGYIGPLVIYFYFLLATIVNKLIMSSIVGLVCQQEKCEGDFRYWHMTVRSYAESILFLNGCKRELRNIAGYFFKLLNIQRKIINAEMLLNFSTYFFDYIGSILSYVVISIPIFAGKYDSLSPMDLTSVISKSSFICMYLISCFSTLIDLSTRLTDIFAYAHRVGELREHLSRLVDNSDFHGKENEAYITSSGDKILEVNNLTFSAPQSSSNLAKDLNFTLKQNESMLITGKAGRGKTSLLRVLRGVWKPFQGDYTFFIPKGTILFVPQKTFLTSGSLVDQVIYPLYKNNTIIDYKTISSILEEVGLDNIISRVGCVDSTPSWNWSSTLSPGEIQRLSFARILYHQPTLALMDEPTSALGEDEEALLYSACKRRSVTLLTIGHRESLRKFHDSCLEIEGGGSWNHQVGSSRGCLRSC